MTSFPSFIMYLVLLGVVSKVSVVDSKLSSKAMEGYPEGFLSDCPNITKPVTKHDLNFLYLVVRGPRSKIRIRYNYYHAHLIAKNPMMDWTKKVFIYIGGFGDFPEWPNVRLLEKIYNRKGYNVILLDEMYFVGRPIYPLVATNQRTVAFHIAEMLATVYKAGALDPANIEMIGMSMGGHTMGFVARDFYKLTGKKIAHLVGLDPSGPCFRNLGPEGRLSENDAEFVEVLHSNIDGFGMAAQLGHADFYINGGESQLSDSSMFAPCDSPCSHMKAFTAWIAAISVPSSNFMGVKCKNIQQARFRQCYDNFPMVTNTFGPKIDKSKHGIFYVSIRYSFPYYMGMKGLNKDNDEMIKFKKGINKIMQSRFLKRIL